MNTKSSDNIQAQKPIELNQPSPSVNIPESKKSMWGRFVKGLNQLARAWKKEPSSLNSEAKGVAEKTLGNSDSIAHTFNKAQQDLQTGRTELENKGTYPLTPSRTSKTQPATPGDKLLRNKTEQELTALKNELFEAEKLSKGEKQKELNEFASGATKVHILSAASKLNRETIPHLQAQIQEKEAKLRYLESKISPSSDYHPKISEDQKQSWAKEGRLLYQEKKEGNQKPETPLQSEASDLPSDASDLDLQLPEVAAEPTTIENAATSGIKLKTDAPLQAPISPREQFNHLKKTLEVLKEKEGIKVKEEKLVRNKRTLLSLHSSKQSSQETANFVLKEIFNLRDAREISHTELQQLMKTFKDSEWAKKGLKSEAIKEKFNILESYIDARFNAENAERDYANGNPEIDLSRLDEITKKLDEARERLELYKKDF